MTKSVEATRHEFGIVRTGRATPALLDRVDGRLLRRVDAAATSSPTITRPRRACSSIQPYDKASIKAIEKAILESDVGLTPTNDGNLIRLAIPELTEERRKDLVKVVRNDRRGGPRRDPQRPPRRDARPARAARRRRGRRRRRAPRRGGAAEADRRRRSPSSTGC